jgi:CHAT domain-containing protein
VAISTDPLLGFVALSDGRLTAGQIQSVCTPARLVVLSGCQTGLGGQHAGGIIGLTRAFQLAGADEVMMSLWSVDDAATEQLMYLFWTNYVRRREAETASDVLRASMIELRREYPNPRYWAAFEVFGAPN